MHQHASELVNDLRGNAAYGARDDRLLFPQALGHGKAKAFLQRLLHDHGGGALQRVDLQGRPRRQVEDDHIRIIARGVHHFLQHHSAFGIVGGAAPGEHELAVDVLLHQLIGLNNAHGVLEAVKAGDLGDDRTGAVNAEVVANLVDELFRQVFVLLRERIDRRIKKILRD